MRFLLLQVAFSTGCVAVIVLFLAASGTGPVRDGVDRTFQEAHAAAVFFVESITAAQIRNDYAQVNAANAGPNSPAKKVRILIVPGHQPDSGGASYKGVYERDVVADIADALRDLLSANPHYDVMVSRTKTDWNPILTTYFDTHALEIDTFVASQKAQMRGYLTSGSILPEADQVYHNAAPAAAARELYGINKWTSENGYDITLHLHLNDYAGRRAWSAPSYDGFAIYVPDDQYSNAAASKAVAESIARRLAAYHATSTLPKEDTGIVQDQQLIATGSYNTADDASLLIEYGYIYESQFQNPSVLPVAVADYAYQTYLGLQDFFQDPNPGYGTLSFPYDWEQVSNLSGNSPGIYALQAALRYLGYYPPEGRTFSDCPISGKAGPCTRAALSAYQAARGIDSAAELGPQTRAALAKDLITPR